MNDANCDRTPAPYTSIEVASLLTIAGGFLDAFTYVGHGKVFANAMTGNVVLLGVFSVTGDWNQALKHIPPILAFIAGVFAAHLIAERRIYSRASSPAVICLTLEIIFLLGAALLPDSFPDLALVLGISFTAAMQNSSFQKLGEWSYNSVMTTGNLRRLADGFYLGLLSRERAKGWHQARTFGTICLCFLSGAAIGAACTSRIANFALLLPSALLGLALLRILLKQRGQGN